MFARRALCALHALLVLSLSLAQAQNRTVADFLSPPGVPFDENQGNFDIVSKLLRLANLSRTVNGLANVTILAPTDGAFVRTVAFLTAAPGAAAPDERSAFAAAVTAVTSGIRVGNGTRSGIGLLREVLLYHVVPGRVTLAMLLARPATVSTLSGSNFIISAANGELVDRSPLTPNPLIVMDRADILLANGVIVHAIDKVLLPVPVQLPVRAGINFTAPA